MIHRQFQVGMSLALSVVLGVGPAASVWASTDWYTLKANGRTIGKVSIQRYPAPQGQAGMVTEVSNVNHFTREGSPFEMNATSRFVESPDGHTPLRFSYRYELGEQRLVEAEGHLSDGALNLQMLGESGPATGQSPVRSDKFLFPGGAAIQKVYQQHFSDQPGSQFSFQTLHLGVQPQIVDSEVTVIGAEKLALATGERKPVQKFEIANPGNRKSRIYEWRDADGKLYKAKSVGQDGMEMVYASQREVRAIDRETLDIVKTTAVVSNQIPQPRLTEEALYKIQPLLQRGMSGGTGFSLPGSIPESHMQHIEKASLAGLQGSEPDTIYLRVTRKDATDSLSPFPVQGEAQYLQATPYLEVQDPALETTAREVIGRETRAYFAARQLQQWVYKNIAHKDLSLGFATAKQTLVSRQGDCTEHAVLLAALLRTLGIPSRVAVGLIYIPEPGSTLGRFVYHMWTEAYIGKGNQAEWVALDATNPEPLPDATHIKLADSALSQPDDLMNLTQSVTRGMGRIRLEVVTATSPAQSVLSIGKSSGALSLSMPEFDIEAVDIRKLSLDAIQHYRVGIVPKSMSEDSAEGLFTLGVEAISQGRYEDGQRKFEKALNITQKPLELYLLGERLLSVEQYALAEQAFQRAKAKNPAFGPYIVDWQRLAMPNRPLPEALQRQFIEAISLREDRGDSAGAVTLLHRIIANEPAFAPAYRELGKSTTGAEASEALNRAVTLNLDDLESIERLADEMLAQRKAQSAYQLYQTALRRIHAEPLARIKPWTTQLQAKSAIAEGTGLLARNKHSGSGWLKVGKGLLLGNRLTEAGKALDNALRVQPGWGEAQALRFEVALRQNDWAYLHAHAGSMAGLTGSSALAARLRGEYDLRTRQYSQAGQNFRRAVSLAPSQAENYLGLVSYYQRQAEQAIMQGSTTDAARQSRLKAAHARVEQALRSGVRSVTDPQDRDRLSVALVEVLIEQGQYDEAVSTAQTLMDANPLNGEGYRAYGKALFYAGQAESATAALKNALLLLPNDPKTLIALGQVAEEAQQNALALEYYQKAYKADGGSYESAAPLRSLMTRLQLAGKKPPAYQQLTADEHDYIVQLMLKMNQILAMDEQVVAAWEKVHAQSMKATAAKPDTSAVANGSAEAVKAALATAGVPSNVIPKTGAKKPQSSGTSLTLQDIAGLQDLTAMIQKVSHYEASVYQQLQGHSVPPRLQRLHYASSLMVRESIDMNNRRLSLIGFHSTEEYKQLKADYDRFTVMFKKDVIASFLAESQVIFRALPPRDVQALQAESSLAGNAQSGSG